MGISPIPQPARPELPHRFRRKLPAPFAARPKLLGTAHPATHRRRASTRNSRISVWEVRSQREGTLCRERPRGPKPISLWWSFHMREDLTAPRLESPINLGVLFRLLHESVYRNLKGLDQSIYLHS